MSDSRGPIGVLLVNVGTPDGPTPRDVRRYLRQFLGDARVLDIPPVARWLLLNLVILPSRPRRAAEAYRAIWTSDGSPLLSHGRRFARALQETLGDDFAVALSMRYGSPSIDEGIRSLTARRATRWVVFPLYPQYASSTTGSALEAVLRRAASLTNVPALACVPPFFREPGFLRAVPQIAWETLREIAADHFLFSFHGLPERHILKADASGNRCLRTPECCATISAGNQACYRAQCFETARQLSSALGLADGSWSVSFQSRVGRGRWVGPSTDRVIVDLARGGVRRLAVFCPSFVADCLETLEEIALRERDRFVGAGGESLRLVPSLNDSPAWVEGAAEIVRRAASSFV